VCACLCAFAFVCVSVWDGLFRRVLVIGEVCVCVCVYVCSEQCPRTLYVSICVCVCVQGPRVFVYVQGPRVFVYVQGPRTL
jgi:hypothetical protein